MKKMMILLLAVAMFIACSREWNNIFDTDDDLSNIPLIESVVKNTDLNYVITLDYSYSDSCTVVLRRKSTGGFQPISYVEITSLKIMDNNFDKEINHNFTYQVHIEKFDLVGAYSNEYSTSYTATALNPPDNLLARTVEEQGIELSWDDMSSNEDGYEIQKDDGSGFEVIDSITANRESYFDEIGGLQNPMQLSYRVKAYNSEFSSSYDTIETIYSGIGSPTNLVVNNNSSCVVEISWDDSSDIETGFLLERSKNWGAYVEIAELDSNSTQYYDYVTEIATYSYRVFALLGNNYSGYSNVDTCTITELTPTEGLVAYYPFSGNANDESGNGNDGSVEGATPTPDRFGNEESAYDFDGVDDYINIGNNVKPYLPLSVSFWINKDTNEQGGIFRSDDENAGAYGILINATSVIAASLRDGSTYNQMVTDSDVIVLSNWQHLTVIFNSSNNIQLFIDNIEYFVTTTGDAENLLYSSDDGSIGKHNVNSTDGKIDDVRVYDRALTEAEILALYHEGGWDIE